MRTASNQSDVLSVSDKPSRFNAPAALSPKFDAIWLVGSLVVPILFYGIYRWASAAFFTNRPEAAVLFFFAIFTTFFDAPHIFATIGRSHLDKEEFRRRRVLHLLALPIAIAISVGAPVFGYEDIFLTLFGLYGSWHIMRQNIGFLKLYHRGEPPSKVSGRWEIYWMYVLLAFYITHETNSVGDIFGNWPQPIPSSWLELLQWTARIALVGLGALILIRAFESKPKFVPWVKLAFIFGSGVLFVWLAFVGAHPLILTAVGTIAHTLQYQGWVWNYHTRRRSVSVARLALGFSMAIGLMIGVGLSDRYVFYGIILPIATIYNGFVLWHYFVDGYVWRMRDAPELRKIIPRKFATHDL